MSDEAEDSGTGRAEPSEMPPHCTGLPTTVERWELNGGTWRVQSLTDTHAVVELRRCDGGEIAELTTLTDPHDLRWARLELVVEERFRSCAEPTAPDNPDNLDNTGGPGGPSSWAVPLDPSHPRQLRTRNPEKNT